jgi:FkbM family methyltransferase
MLLYKVLSDLLRSDAGLKHPLRVLTRFGYLQLRRRVGPSPFMFVTATGTRALVERRGDFSAITGLFYLDIPDLQEVAFASHALRPREVFWDIGANQGFWSLLLAGRGVDAHAFEPTPVTFQHQSKQFAAQASPYRERLCGHNLAMSSHVGSMRFTVDRGQANYLLKEGEAYAGESAEVKVTTIDAFSEKAPAPNFIKIDVEGWTLPVLEGASSTLTRRELHGLVIETFRYANGATSEMRSVESLLAQHGFHPFSYDPAVRKLTRLTGLNQGRQDTIYARDDEFLRERLRTASPVTCFSDDY